MRDIARLGIFLTLVCLVAAASLSYTYDLTAPRIAAYRAAKKLEALQRVLPGATEYKDETARAADLLAKPEFSAVKTVEVAYLDGRPIGAVLTVAPYGYSGNIVTLVGIKADGVISRVEILNQSETPGLGTKVTLPSFLDQFAGRPIDRPLAVTKDGGDIQAIAGATISPRAVTTGVNQAVVLYQALYGGATK